ncbi:MAG TPA: MASE3 domain-containing protein [Anaerolineaceae bacterium]|nr:MASE3 domain-containing protein [Anaerolineaceae bacterium]
MIESIKRRSVVSLLINLLVGGIIFAGLFWVSLDNLLLFHTLAELFAALIAVSIYILAWNAREFLDNQGILFLAIAYLFVGAIDLAHALTYSGLGIFLVVNPDLSIGLWLAARFLQAVALLIAPFYFQRRFHPRVMTLIFALLTLGLAAVAIRPWNGLPDGTDSQAGFALFRVYAEYGIAAILSAALLLWILKSRVFDTRVARLFVVSIGLTVLSELALTRTETVGNLPVVTGHLLKIVAFFLVYKAVIQTGLKHPYQVLFRNLQKSRDELLKERDFVSAILNTADALVLVLEPNGRVVRFNRAFEKASGLSSADANGCYIWELGLFPENPPQLEQDFKEKRAVPKPLSGELHLRNLEGQARVIAWSSALHQDKERGLQYVIATGIDITDRKQVETELIYMSTHDVLTGLYNRAYFESEMLRLAGSDHFPTSMVMMDLDGLKTVNDTYGHQMGDQIIQKAAQIIRSAFRDEDVIARMGGDEFAVLLPGADESIAEQARLRIHELMKAHNEKNASLPISLSFGSATAIAGYMLMETLKKADNAMYVDKSSHRSRRESN